MSIQLQEVQGKSSTGYLSRYMRGVSEYRDKLSDLRRSINSYSVVTFCDAVINLENVVIELDSFIRAEAAKREALAKLLFDAFPDLKDIEILEETLEARKKEFKENLK